MEPGGSMPHLQGLSNNLYPEPNQPNSSHVSVRTIFQTPPPYSYIGFHFVFQHNKMLLEMDHYTKLT